MASDDPWAGTRFWHTRLHDPIDLVDCTLHNDKLVIMHPDDRADQWLESTAHIDTYDAR